MVRRMPATRNSGGHDHKMLNIYTNTFCRPDYVQVLADALALTVQEEYRFSVIVQPGGLRREWRNVAEVIDGTMTGYAAWRDTARFMNDNTRTVIVHDDCVPMLPWDSSIFQAPACTRRGGSTVQFYIGPAQPAIPMIVATRVMEAVHCPGRWSAGLCEAAANAYAETMFDGTFLHIDKGTLGSPSCGANQYKPALVEAICNELGIEKPDDLTPEELAIHPGKDIRSPRPMGLGDMVASGLSAVGITKERVSQIAGRDCGCKKRQQALNELGKKFGIG